jgi:hypothetical protein
MAGAVGLALVEGASLERACLAESQPFCREAWQRREEVWAWQEETQTKQAWMQPRQQPSLLMAET